MPDRLSPLDASFLYAEHRTAAMHVGAVMTFAPPEDGPFDVAGFTELIGSRLGLVPRYRQKVREVPGRLGLPVWVDDPEFDLDFHVRHAAIAPPGTQEVLLELVGRVLGRRLDRSRPLWEVYVVEGLADGRTAVVTKTHHAMVDGLASMDIGAVLLDRTPQPRETPPDEWHPAREPSGLALAAGAVVDALRTPRAAFDTAGRAVADLGSTASSAVRTIGGAVAAGWQAAGARPLPGLNASTGEQRRYAMARTSLAEHRMVRKAHGGTVNDVVLAVVAGGLRRWLISRGEPLTAQTTVRAMVPTSTRARSSRAGAGNNISLYLVDLPVVEGDPLQRLATLRAVMEAHKRGAQAQGASALIGLAALVPPMVHNLGAHLASRYSSQLYNVLVTTVPGPPRPLYAMGARLIDLYPVVPLGGGQSVAIGITAYDGAVHYGLTADRDAMPDVDVLAGALQEALDELTALS